MFRTLFAIVVFCLAIESPAFGADAASPTRTLSLEDCVRMSLERNFDVQIQLIGPQIGRYGLAGARGGYDPNWSLSFDESFRKSDTRIDPQFGLPFGGDETTTEGTTSSIGGILPVTGMNYSLYTRANRRSGNRFFGSQFDSTAGINLTQPLLRNLWIDNTRRAILISRVNLRNAEHILRNTLINTVTSVEKAYYDLIFRTKNVEVQQMALDLAEQLLEDNKKRVKVGSMAPLEEKQAESQVAARKADLISAVDRKAAQENLLKNLLTDDFLVWIDIKIQPSETLVAVEMPFDKQASWRRGIASRPDLLQLKEDLERQNITVRYRHNQIFPALDLKASYQHIGIDSNAGDVLAETIRGHNPSYSIGAQISIPLGNRGALNSYRQARAEKQQALLRLKQMEQNVLIEIDNAIRTAQTSYLRVEATRDAREYAEAALEAEQKKLANGASTSFVVLQLQNDLTAARSNEISALADYNKALADVAKAEGSTLEKKKIELASE